MTGLISILVLVGCNGEDPEPQLTPRGASRSDARALSVTPITCSSGRDRCTRTRESTRCSGRWRPSAQRQTGGDLGDFCVRCHAPVGVALGTVSQGSDLDGLDADDPALQGVSCWFCHQVDGIDGDHNNPLSLADDATFRGPIADPVATPAHDSAYATTHDRRDLDSAAMCGSCHDIVNPLGTHIERTYAEWRGSVFGRPSSIGGLTCTACHMQGPRRRRRRDRRREAAPGARSQHARRRRGADPRSPRPKPSAPPSRSSSTTPSTPGSASPPPARRRSPWSPSRTSRAGTSSRAARPPIGEPGSRSSPTATGR